MTDAVDRVLGGFVRLVGVALAMFGALTSLRSGSVGVPLVVFGVLFAVWPGVSGLIVDRIGDLLELLDVT